MSPDIQVKLLRALETRTVRRLGGKKEIPVDIRVVAATNRDVHKALDEGDLREDLYYRLAVVDISLPPLRERADDIQLLANEFLQRFAAQNGKQVTGFEDPAWNWVVSYHWPGNVRELKNAVERAVIMARGAKITLGDIVPRHSRASMETPTQVNIAVGSTVADARRQLVLKTFASTGGDVAKTARILGVAEADVRGELLAMVNGVGGLHVAPAGAGGGADGSGNNGAGEAEKRAARRADTPTAPSRAQAKGKSGKKAR
jgi:two-component system response regulator HydG